MYRLRKCDRPSDADQLYEMVRELAEFENALDSLELRPDDYRRDAFDTDRPLFHAVFAEYKSGSGEGAEGDEDKEKGWTAAGYAVWFFSYSTWKGRCLYLEDLYVKPAHRQQGLGKKLYSFCVKEAFDCKCRAFDYIVLKWNERAINMYQSFGVSPRDDDGWHLMRMDADAIAAFMQSRYVE